jgi:triacylglycerol lipase
MNDSAANPGSTVVRRRKHIRYVGRGAFAYAYFIFPLALFIYANAMVACLRESAGTGLCSLYTDTPWAIGYLVIAAYLYVLFLVHEIGYEQNRDRKRFGAGKTRRVALHYAQSGLASLPQDHHRHVRRAHRANSVFLSGIVAYLSFRFINPPTLVTLGLAGSAFFASEILNCWDKPRTAQAWHDLMYPGDAIDFFVRQTFPPFVPQAMEYSRDNARWLMELSRLVYRHDIEENVPAPQPTRSHFLKQAGFVQRNFFLSQETDTQAMLVESTDDQPYAVLVFRGTEQNPKDMNTDLETGVPSLDQDTAGVHEGFREALDSVWEQIAPELAALRCPVFFTGHSLGAALATLAAARHVPAAVYTFGSPRVGNRAFVDSLGELPVYRIVDDEDIITTVPPESLGYLHAGTLQQLAAPAGKSHFARLRNVCMPVKPLADHTPINYLDRI